MMRELFLIGKQPVFQISKYSMKELCFVTYFYLDLLVTFSNSDWFCYLMI